MKIITVILMFHLLSGCAHSVKKLNQKGIYKVSFTNIPSLGTTKAGQEILLGGFSGLRFLGRNSHGNFTFLTHTDRGPVGDAYNGNRPFALPEYSPKLVYFEILQDFSEARITKIINLRTKENKISGLPSKPNLEDPVDVYDYLTDYDENGTDPESVAIDKNGNIWLTNDYRSSLMEFSKEGLLIKRYFAKTDFLAVFQSARFNRGFDGLTFVNDDLWAILQSPLASGEKEPKSPILIFNPKNKKSSVKFYPLDTPTADRIGDIAHIENNSFLVIEYGTDTHKKIYRTWTDKSDTLKKKLYIDLTDFFEEPKPQGIEVFEKRFVAIINDNDFGLRGRPDYLKSGLIPTKTEENYVYIIDDSLAGLGLNQSVN